MSIATGAAAATSAENAAIWAEPIPTALLVLADGTVIEGFGIGAVGEATAEVCFNTAMTGYQEILTDPSYAGQIITFTFPHIGNVGVNDEDIETVNMASANGARGVVLKASITEPARPLNADANTINPSNVSSSDGASRCASPSRSQTRRRNNGVLSAIPPEKTTRRQSRPGEIRSAHRA